MMVQALLASTKVSGATREVKLRMKKTSRLDSVLEAVEMLQPDEQEYVAEVLAKRLAERRREELARDVRASRRDYAAGKVRRGTAEDVMRDLLD